MNRSALEGIRITDFTWAGAGPYATLLLSFLGAQVIKVESNRRLDTSRRSGSRGGKPVESVDQSASFNDFNLNKMSITADLKHPKALELIKRTIAVSDAVIDNFRPGVLDRLGLGYPVLKEINPSIVMLSSSAFGATGPDASYGGWAFIFAALAGLSHITGYSDGIPTELRLVMDLTVGSMSAYCLLGALHHRRKTGEGQFVDLSSRQTLSCCMGEVLLDYAMNGRNQGRLGNSDPFMCPHGCYPCKGDYKWVTIAVESEEDWRNLVTAMRHPDWARDGRFADAYLRKKNEAELNRLIGEWTKDKTAYEVMQALQKVGVAATPTMNAEDLFKDPHLRARKLYTQVNHPLMGAQYVANPPFKLSGTPATVRRHGPLLGEHNDFVFGELLGLPEQEVKNLEEQQILF